MVDEKHRGGFLTNRRRLLKTGGVFAGASALLGGAPTAGAAGSSAESSHELEECDANADLET